MEAKDKFVSFRYPPNCNPGACEEIARPDLLSRSALADRFLVTYGDTLLNVDLARMCQIHEQSRDATLFLHPDIHPKDSVLVETDRNDWVTPFLSASAGCLLPILCMPASMLSNAARWSPGGHSHKRQIWPSKCCSNGRACAQHLTSPNKPFAARDPALSKNTNSFRTRWRSHIRPNHAHKNGRRLELKQ